MKSVAMTGAEDRPPTVDTAAFARSGGEARGEMPLSSMRRLVEAGVTEEGVLTWHVQASSARDETGRQRQFIQVDIAFGPTMACSRCLDPVVLDPIQASTRFRFAASERQAEIEDREESEIEVLAHDAALDLAGLIEDEAILALPMLATHEHCPTKIGESDSAGAVS